MQLYNGISYMMKKMLIGLMSFTIILGACGSKERNVIEEGGLQMAVRMADSEMKHFPESWAVDFNKEPSWNYTQGLIAQSMLQVWQVTQNQAYYNYAKSYADLMIDSVGAIPEYKPKEYNIDQINSGKFLFMLYNQTKDERYKNSIYFMRGQLTTHPRTSEGGFWHKLRYPNQMWLDGLYMGAPFYTQYASVFNEPAIFDDVVNQFITVHKHTYCPETGLNYHGWDESKVQKWANPETGCSPNFWGRAMGWYAMALVDVLDFIPLEHPGRPQLIGILDQVAAGIKKYQDEKTGLWYQVLDKGSREGNYFEATASSMFTYALLKAVRKEYIDPSFKQLAVKGYKGILKNLIKENEDGTISLTKCCAVAGLGGNPYRDGSFEYYVNESVRDNDPKGVGPFIMASLEYELIK